MGPSGSGKSTLLNVIGGLLPPSAGRVVLNGRDLATLGADELARVRGVGPAKLDQYGDSVLAVVAEALAMITGEDDEGLRIEP